MVWKGPFLLRYSIIRWAMVGPTPVIFSSSCWLAVLIFILADCCGVTEGDGRVCWEFPVGTGGEVCCGVGIRRVGVVEGDELSNGVAKWEVEVGEGDDVYKDDSCIAWVGVTEVLPRFDLFEDPRSNPTGLGVVIASTILDICCSGLPINKNKLPTVANPEMTIISNLWFN